MRIANAFFRERDDFLSEDFDGGVGSIRKPEGCARHLECEAHDAPSLGVEVGAIQIWGDGHNTLGSAIGLSATGACRRAAAGDDRHPTAYIGLRTGEAPSIGKANLAMRGEE